MRKVIAGSPLLPAGAGGSYQQQRFTARDTVSDNARFSGALLKSFIHPSASRLSGGFFLWRDAQARTAEGIADGTHSGIPMPLRRRRHFFAFSPSSTRRHFTEFLLKIFVAKLVCLILQQKAPGKYFLLYRTSVELAC
jgi:hypothetical protein